MVRTLLFRLVNIFELILLIRCVLSFFPIRGNAFTKFVYMVTEPVLAPIRNLIQRYYSGMAFDLSPLIVFLLLRYVVERLIRIFIIF